MTRITLGLALAFALLTSVGAANASYYCVEKKTVTVEDHSVSTPVVCVPGP